MSKGSKVVIEEDFAKGVMPSYINTGSVTTISADPLPDNKFKITSNTTGGLYSIESTFSIQTAKYKKVTLEFLDVMASPNKSLIRFGVTGIDNVNYAVFYLRDPGSLGWTEKTIEIFGNFKNLGQITNELYRNVDFSRPLDFKMEFNIKERYADFIVEGYKVRIDNATPPDAFRVTFCKIQSSESGVAKEFSFKKFKLILE